MGAMENGCVRACLCALPLELQGFAVAVYVAAGDPTQASDTIGVCDRKRHSRTEKAQQGGGVAMPQACCAPLRHHFARPLSAVQNCVVVPVLSRLLVL